MSDPAERVLADEIEEIYMRGLDGPEAAVYLIGALTARGYRLVRTDEPVDPATPNAVYAKHFHELEEERLRLEQIWRDHE